MTAAEFAPAVLQAGIDAGITPRGITIAFATVYVESGWTMYANAAVPDSMSIPHEAVGSDSYSVGLFQQQVFQGSGGWWWGDAATCMDPYKSAQLFYGRLAKLDYNNTANSPGSYAQAVQQSAFPDRYDQRMGDAVTLYQQLTAGGIPVAAPQPATDPRLAALAAVRPDFNEYANWSNNCQDREGTLSDLWLLHTEEGDMNADALVKWMNNNGVSYHYAGSQDPTDGGVTVVDMVDTDDASWSVLSSNDRAVNFCFAGSYTAWTRDQWIAQAGKVIDVAAYLAVQDVIKYPSLAPTVIVNPYTNPPGIADHRYCTAFLKDGNNHTDVGDNFPWDIFSAAVSKYWATANGAQHPDPHPGPTTPPTFGQWVSAATDRELLEYITNQLGPGDPSWSSVGATLRDELWKLATPAAQQQAKEDK